MNDRELLEMAAKAAGLSIPCEPEGRQDPDGSVVWWDCEGKRYVKIWNPLKDDGDALRLAIKLDIHIKRFAGVTIAEEWTTLNKTEEWTTLNKTEEHDSWPWNNGNQLVSTRRAIVRAAAEIGKAKP